MGNVQIERPCYGGANPGAKPEAEASQQQQRFKKNHHIASQFCVKNRQRGDIARGGAETEEKTSGRHKDILH